MYRKETSLKSENGLHARLASVFVKQASKYKSEVSLIKENQRYNAKSIMGILSMGIRKGDPLIIEAQGIDEKEAVDSLIEIIENME